MSYDSVILADTPQAYYLCNDVSGSTALDSTSNHFDGTYQGSFTLAQPGIPSAGGTSVLLAGTTGQLVVPAQLAYTTWSTFSLEFWIDAGGGWQHTVVTASNATGQLLLYANGTQVSPSASGTIAINANLETAGSAQTTHLAKVAIYAYVLSALQISQHYRAGTLVVITLPAFNRRSGLAAGTARRDALVMPFSRRDGQSGSTRRTGTGITAVRRLATGLATARRG